MGLHKYWRVSYGLVSRHFYVVVLVFFFSTNAFAAQATKTLAHAKPTIMSINLCADQLLIDIADAEQIISLSKLGTDRRSSLFHKEAKHFAQNSGRLEEVLIANPDLVVMGRYDDMNLRQALVDHDIHVVILDPAQSLETVFRNIALLGQAAHQVDRARSVIEKMKNMADPTGQQVIEIDAKDGYHHNRSFILHIDLNGYVHAGQTLLDDLITKAGFIGAGEILSVDGYRSLSLEKIVSLTPNFVSFGSSWADPPARASYFFRHAALKEWKSKRVALDLDHRYWQCGSRKSVELIEQLRKLEK